MRDGDSKSGPKSQLRGSLLLADPSLRDGIFDQSVVLLAEHSEKEGAFGLILNHPTGRTVGDFLNGPEFEPLRRIPVFEGGPVAREQLTFSAFWWSPRAGLRWATRISLQDAVKHSNHPGTIVRAFVGHSGWSPGQVEVELRRNAWITLRPARDLLGVEHDRPLWRDLMRGLSPLHRILAEAPTDPSLN